MSMSKFLSKIVVCNMVTNCHFYTNGNNFDDMELNNKK